MELEKFLQEDYKNGYRYINEVEDEDYRIVALYNDSTNKTKFFISDKKDSLLKYFEFDYDLFRKEVLKCEKS